MLRQKWKFASHVFAFSGEDDFYFLLKLAVLLNMMST